MNEQPIIEGEIVEDRALAVRDRDRALTVGEVANEYARAAVFDDFLSGKAANTIRRHHVDLTTFADYLKEATATKKKPEGDFGSADDFQHTPDAWQGITWGLVESFKRWLLGEGYAIGTVNLKLSTVRTYAEQARKAGAIPQQEYALIRLVKGYTHKEGRHVDEKREAQGQPTRRGSKKAEAVKLSEKDANKLKRLQTEKRPQGQPNTPQGRRDALLMSLLLDLGLRVGEVAQLKVTDFDLKEKTVKVERPKVDLIQTHALGGDVWRAVKAWFDSGDAPAVGPLLRGSHKGGALTDPGMSARAITGRVRVLGEAVGVEGLSAHDCRHYWATAAVKDGVNAFRLQQAGGWASMVMPQRYVEASEIANEGML